MLQIQSPFQQLFDTNGSPLDDGYVYIGTANANPETSPIAIYWDDAGTIPAAQPLRTLNGYIVRSGTPARVYTAADDFSMTVKDKQGRVVFSVLDATADSNLTTALASSSGSSLVGFLQSGANAQLRTVQSKLRDVVSVRDFGAVGDGVTDDRAAFISAVVATPVGGVLFVPASTSFYSINTSGGLTSAIQINKRMTIALEGEIRPTFEAIQANPPTIFHVTGDDVSIEGTGKLKGSGTVNSVNTGTDATMPSLVRVTGNSFTMRGLTIDTPFKVGVHLVGCFYAKITGTNFTGGPVAYSDTAYFGVRASGGGKHAISGNQFYPDANGGMYVQCIFFSATSDCVIDGNVATRPYEKLAYLNGDRNVVTGNSVVGNSGTIPGTNQQGTVGVVIRCDGANNKITNNYTIHGGGAACRIGGGNDISNNTFLNAGQSGIAVFDASSVLDYTTIRNNTITCGNLAGVLVTNGIQLTPLIGSNKYIDISGNMVSGFGITDPIANIATWQLNTAYPTVSSIKPSIANSRYYITTGGGTSGGVEPTWPTTPGATVIDGTITWTCQAFDTANASINLGGSFAYDYCTITDNTLIGGFYGVKTANLNNSRVSYSTIVANSYGISETSGASNKYERNQVSAPNPGVLGLAGTSRVFDFEYEEGSWTPNQGSGLTVSGSFSSTGRYTKIGRIVHVSGSLSGSTSISIASPGIVFTNLPFTIGGVAAGSLSTSSLTSPGVVTAISGTTVYGSTVSPAVSTIYFSLTYSV